MLFFLIRLEELVMPFALIDNSCIGFIPCWGQKKNSLRSHLQENDQKCRQGRNSSEEEIGGQIFDLLVELLLSCEGLKEGGRDSKDYLLGSKQLSGSLKFRFWHELQFSQFFTKRFTEDSWRQNFKWWQKMYCKKLFRGLTNHGFHWDEMLSPSRAP